LNNLRQAPKKAPKNTYLKDSTHKYDIFFNKSKLLQSKPVGGMLYGESNESNSKRRRPSNVICNMLVLKTLIIGKLLYTVKNTVTISAYNSSRKGS